MGATLAESDTVRGTSFVEVLVGARDSRRLRIALMEVARQLARTSERRGILILDNPQVSQRRLVEEWEGLRAILRPELFQRLAMVIHREKAPHEVLGEISGEEREKVNALVANSRRQGIRPLRRPAAAFFEILRILLVHWFRKSGPLTSKELGHQAGFSYPTISAALEKLEPYLARHSDRRVELHSFPRDAWFKLVAQSEKVRSSQGYSDRSGRPGPTEVLMGRLQELGRDDIGVSGVLGARHYVPGLDLIGTPRLDFVVHAEQGKGGNEFLRRLEPALKPAERGEVPQVVIHTLYRPASFFQVQDTGTIWADEVECLLDLHEMRLESQALEFAERLTSQAKPCAESPHPKSSIRKSSLTG